ncbi:MAG: hypothetical protein ABR588_09665 [Sphingomicrobium sp.]|nr:hypothetical protein [Sphingomonadales bacterium]
MDPTNWEIGPIIGSQNYSSGTPLHPLSDPAGWVINIPQPDSNAGHVNYVTTRYGSLSGKKRIVLNFRIEADPSVKIVPTDSPDAPSILTIYFQRRGDDWSGSGIYEAFRWWATSRSLSPLTPGEYQITAQLDEPWSAVQTSTTLNNQPSFQSALADADRVGFTFGGGSGYGHGVYATGPTRFVVTNFRVE